MAVSTPSFAISLQKITKSIKPEEILSLHYVSLGKFIIAQFKNGDVVAFNVKYGLENSTVIVSHVIRIRLSSGRNTRQQSASSVSFLALSRGSCLTVHNVSLDRNLDTVSASCHALCSKQQLETFVHKHGKADLSDAFSIHLLEFESSSSATILCNSIILQLSLIQGQEPDLKELLALVFEVKEGAILQAKMLHGLVFLLHQSGNITVHSLNRKMAIANIHFQKFLQQVFPSATKEMLQVLHPDCFDVSPDLQHIILTQPQTKFNIYKLNLNEYFDTYPYYFKVQRSGNAVLAAKDVDEDEVILRHGGIQGQADGAGSMSWLNKLSSVSRVLSRSKTKPCSSSELTHQCKTKPGVNWFERVGISAETIPKSDSTLPGSTITKELPKLEEISGFDKPRPRQDSFRPSLIIKKQREEADLFSSLSTAIRATKAFRDLTAAGMFVTGSSAVIWYRGNPKLDPNKGRYGGVCLVDFTTNDIDFYSFVEPVVVTFAHNSSHPHLLLSSGCIEALAYGVDQETLVNKLMIYSSAGLAETVCHLNRWDHYSIPIHALEIGLKQRQLDTVAFFLKSRENVFKYCPAPSAPARVGSPRTPPLTAEQTQLWPAIDLLMTSIRDHARDHQSRQYAMQLLNLSLSYVNKLLSNATETLHVLRYQDEDETLGLMEGFHLTEDVLEDALQKLMAYMREMWGYLNGCPKWVGERQIEDSPSRKDEVDTGSTNFFMPEDTVARNHIKQWQKMTQQNVIKDAILKRCLPLAQAYLQGAHGGSEFKVQMSDLIDQGLHLTLKSLLDNDLDTAIKILQRMGYNVNKQLKKMCLYTANHTLRNFLIEHLSRARQFSQVEREMINFVQQLEHVYTCQSFGKAKTLALESGKRTWAGVVPPKQSLNFLAQNFLETQLQWGELVTCEPPNCENFHYAHIVLEWVRTWDQETRERVLLDVLLNSKDTSFRPALHSQSIWRYLTSHADWKHLAEWIATSFPSSSSHAKPEHHNPILTQPLYVQGVDDLGDCPGYFRDKILDELASRGIFSSTELSKFDLLLTRLGRSLQLFADSSRFQGDRDVVERFNQWLIEYCLKEDLPSILYLYFDYYGLYLSENEVISMQPPLSESRWLEMLLHFRWVGRQATDPSLMFQASLSNSRLLLGNIQPTVSQLLASGHPLVAIATLIFAPGSFSEAMTPASTAEEELWKVDAKTLEAALKPYPKLQTAVFPPIDVDGVSQQDITVYQVLQGNCFYDPARLFKFQTTNPLIHRKNATEMPHFSQPQLANQYAYMEPFRFTYYLHQGRPCFAYLAFLASQLQDGGSLTKKKVLAAYMKAYSTALKHVSNRTTAASCVAFIEMLGQDSLSVRIDLQTALTILEYSDCTEGGRTKTTKKKERLEDDLVRMLLNCLQGFKKNAQDVLRLLEDAIIWKLKLSNIDLSSWEASEEWSLAILLCQRHKLPLSSVYPEQCAKDNQWLHFTCFVQAHQYHKQQVLDLLSKFTSTTIREHLQDAFRNLHLGPAIIRDDLPPSTSRPLIPMSAQRVRDVKAHYYHRVGFLRKQNAEVSSDEDSTSESGDAVSTDDGIPQIVPQDLNVNRVPKDLFGVLFECNDAPIPWKSLLAHTVALKEPVLAVIAVCYKECVTLDCLCVWLLTSLGDETSISRVTGSMASVQWHSWALEELTSIIEVAMETGLVSLLARGFQIFDKDCALNSFLNFCEAILVKHDTTEAKTYLQDFHSAILKCRRKGMISSASQGSQTSPIFKIGNLSWYEETASAVVYYMVSACPTYWDTCCLLEVLAQANFSRIVSRQVPDYSRLHQMTEALKDTPVYTRITCLLEGTEYMEECQRVLQSLKDAKLFHKARDFAKVTGLPADQVIVEQLLCDLGDLKMSKVWCAEAGRMSFWTTCHNTLKSNYVSGSIAAKFFQSQVEEQSDLQPREKAILLSLAHRWLVKETSTSSEHKVAVERLQQEAWSWRLKAEVEKMDATPVPPSLLEGAFSAGDREKLGNMDFKCQLSEELVYIANVKVDAFAPPILKDEKELKALNLILAQLLDKCCIQKAHRLAQQFNHPHLDISIILTSIQLATGVIAPAEIKPEMKRLVAGVGSGLVAEVGLGSTLGAAMGSSSITPMGSGLVGAGLVAAVGSLPGIGGMTRGRPRRTSDAWRGMMSRGMLARSASTMSISSLTSQDQTDDLEETDETLSTLEALCASCSTQAKQCCDRIINAYRIAQVLGSTYKSVVVQAPFDSLRAILRCNHPQRFALAKTFILANEMSDAQVAGFLCEAVITRLKACQSTTRRRERGLSSRVSSASLTSYINQELDGREEFGQLIQLCRNPAILGNRLLQEASSMVSSDVGNSKTVLTMEVELIIRAHDCHTVCCNMEGISNVLRKCRECSDALAMSEEFTLLVRLLTGVGRYCEMSYMFDILRANQQFELLLKTEGKDDNLKVALLDYLKRCDPPDTEAYNFVAVKFEMNREIAELLERDAHEQLKAMNKKNMDANIELQNSLQNVLQDFTKAAQTYAKDNCLRHAEQCIKQARLIALQLHLLPTKQQVINLDSKRITSFMNKHPKFHEALIVADAYGTHTCWPNAIYHNVVLQGDFKYLEDFSKCRTVSDTLFREVAHKYRQESNRLYQSTSNMKKLLGYCKEVLTAYKLATELSFQDVAVSLLEGEAGAYLKDVA